MTTYDKEFERAFETIKDARDTIDYQGFETDDLDELELFLRVIQGRLDVLQAYRGMK